MIEEIEVPLKKTLLNILFLVLLLFVALCFGFILYPEGFTSSEYDSVEWIRIFGGIAVVIIGMGAVLLGKKLFSAEPGLVINNIGIIDNGTGYSVGLVYWEDISSLKITGVSGAKMFLLVVKDSQKYINNVNSKFAKGILRLNNKIYGSPIVIPSSTLQIDVEDLERRIRRALKKKNEILQMSKEALRPLRSKEVRGDFFMLQTDGLEILFPSYPEAEGTNLLDIPDSPERDVIVKEISIALKHGEGFVEGYFKSINDNNNKSFSYRSNIFIKYFMAFSYDGIAPCKPSP